MRFFLFFFSCLSISAFGQRLTQLKHELDSMYVLDQRNRQVMTKLGNNRRLSDSLCVVYKTDRTKLVGILRAEQTKIDTSNLDRIDAILKQHGYPGKTLVGTPTNESVFYMIQHSRKADTYLPVLKKAVDAGELPFHQYALMLDQSLMHSGKPQVYGTQVLCRQIRASSQFRCFVWPITDYRRVNERRKQAGFTLTVAENAIRLNAAYNPAITLDEVRNTYVLD